MQVKRHLVYGLVDPRTDFIRYIGRSSRGLERPKAHRYPCNMKQHQYSARWVSKLVSLGLMYNIVVLEEFDSHEPLCEAERWWIFYGRLSEWPLTNISDGGEGRAGRMFSEEHRKKLGDANRRRVWTPESRAKISGDLSPTKRPEVKAKISGDRSASKRPEVRAAISAAHLEHWKSVPPPECGSAKSFNHATRLKRTNRPSCGPCHACRTAKNAYTREYNKKRRATKKVK